MFVLHHLMASKLCFARYFSYTYLLLLLVIQPVHAQDMIESPVTETTTTMLSSGINNLEPHEHTQPMENSMQSNPSSNNPSSQEISQTSTTLSTETGTRYPIIFIHGFLGSAHILFSDYFFGIEDALKKQGVVSYTATVPAVNSTQIRSDALYQYLLELQKEHHYEKFNLIGHSHGGISARQIGGDHPELVASITTIGSPNNGAYVSDYIIAHPFWRWSWPIEFFGWAGNRLDGKSYPQDYKAYLNSTSTAGIRTFNQQYPAGLVSSPCGEGKDFENGMYHFSFGGVKTMTRFYDPMDWLLALQGTLTDEPNDGWITSCSTRYGKVIDAELPMNHMDLVNHMWGFHLKEAKPIDLYIEHAKRLRDLGL